MMRCYFPFTAVVGQDDFKLCLLLNLVDPTIGGILATGDKGAGKTTTVRALSQLMGADFPFVNLPIGATQDSVLGSVDIEVLINQKKILVDKGLLAKSNGGFLYIDEVNLLNDYLIDILLDASSSGGYHLERDGISQWLESRFCLVGTMNPEEGDLRPQLRDRFGLCVNIKATTEHTLRKKIALQRMDFDTDNQLFYDRFKDREVKLQSQVFLAREILNEVNISDQVQDTAITLALEARVEGVRADILLLKTARAYAALLGKKEATLEMLHKIAPFVLSHRSMDADTSSDHQNDRDQGSSQDNDSHSPQDDSQFNTSSFQLPQSVKKGLKFSKQKPSKKPKPRNFSTTTAIQSSSLSYNKTIDLVKTLKNYLTKQRFTLVYKPLVDKPVHYVVFLLDTSGSMVINQQLGYIKGIVQKTVYSNKFTKVQYALVTLDKSSARVLQRFTTDTKKIIENSYALSATGKTNLGAAFMKVAELIKSVNKKSLDLFILTDGKVNEGAQKPMEFAIRVYKRYLSSKVNKTTVVDTEHHFVKLAKAKYLAKRLSVAYEPCVFV